MNVAAHFDLAGAVDRLARYFGSEAAATRQGLLAREALGQPVPADATLRTQLAATLHADLRADGSAGGGVVPTIWCAHELLDLGQEDDPATGRLVRWIVSLQQRPGAFGEGCAPERHRHRVCEHFVGGFFSAGPAEQRVTPITLPNGKVFRAEPAARFAISCFALRTVLRAGVTYHGLSTVQRHLASLLHLSELWTSWTGYFAPDLIVAGLHTLAFAPASYREPIPRLVTLLAEQQEAGGLWPNADLFSILDALLAVGSPDARTLVRRTLPALVERQRPDGTFGATAQQERAWIGLRALLWSK